MKKMISFFLTILMVGSLTVNAFAYISSYGSCNENGWYEFNEKSGELVISKADTNKESKCSDTSRFHDVSEIKSIIIEEGFTEISKEVFCDCENLEKLVIKNGVKYIGKGAFLCCTNLRTIEFPETLEKIDRQAFYGCPNISVMVFNGNEPDIESDVFNELGQNNKVNVYTNGWQTHFFSAYTEKLNFKPLSFYSASIFSQFSTELICCIGGLAVGFVAAMLIFRKKKN